MSDDFKCHHPKNSTSTVCYHHDGIEYCSEKCFHECIARKAEHNREAAKHDSHHVGPHQNPNSDHHKHGPSDHGNIITDLNPRFAPHEGSDKDITHDKFSKPKAF